MSTMKALIGVVALMTSTAAWPAVMVHDSQEAGPTTNYISEGNFSSGQIGGPPPRPWQCSKNTEKVRVSVEIPVGRPGAERWVRLVDDDNKESANIRRSFPPVTSGRFQLRLISNKEGGRLFFNLGIGIASKPEDRAVQLSIESDGSLMVRGERKSRTSTRIRTGKVYLVRCDLEPVKDRDALRVLAELVEESTQRASQVETEVMTQLAISAVRVTSTTTDTGVDYYVTDVSLTGR
jgi:hypothetical protein